jgi:hypothetical protein
MRRRNSDGAAVAAVADRGSEKGFYRSRSQRQRLQEFVQGLRRRQAAMTRSARQSNHAELHPPRFADHVLVPGRVPDQLDIGLIDAVDR